MKTRTKVWLTVAAAFTTLNVAFVFIVGTHDGLLHPGAHALLALAGGYWVWRVARASTPSAAAREGRAASLRRRRRSPSGSSASRRTWPSWQWKLSGSAKGSGSCRSWWPSREQRMPYRSSQPRRPSDRDRKSVV